MSQTLLDLLVECGTSECPLFLTSHDTLELAAEVLALRARASTPVAPTNAEALRALLLGERATVDASLEIECLAAIERLVYEVFLQGEDSGRIYVPGDDIVPAALKAAATATALIKMTLRRGALL